MVVSADIGRFEDLQRAGQEGGPGLGADARRWDSPGCAWLRKAADLIAEPAPRQPPERTAPEGTAPEEMTPGGAEHLIAAGTAAYGSFAASPRTRGSQQIDGARVPRLPFRPRRRLEDVPWSATEEGSASSCGERRGTATTPSWRRSRS
ncbi:hypothetical protein FRZ03_07515 [Streptomyces misionensis]|uniref:Uncharacterized protein n=1 Tax=Streptomyces misionensis TaxID=67331 RepID=A0A5C6JXU7_9ACTN|nr:hypothetical protein FRZ03_07515 [Streptomyces misionensis]